MAETTHERQAEKLAQMFHETYERLAPEHGYETREASAVPWEGVPAANKSLMVAVASRIYDAYITTQLQQARAHAIDQRARAEHAEAERDALKAELAVVKRNWKALSETTAKLRKEVVGRKEHGERLTAELAEARAAIERLTAERVRAEHFACRPYRCGDEASDMGGKERCHGCRRVWPCPPIAALDAPQRPESTREETGLTVFRCSPSEDWTGEAQED